MGVIEQMLWFSNFLGSNVDEGGSVRRLVMKGVSGFRLLRSLPGRSF